MRFSLAVLLLPLLTFNLLSCGGGPPLSPWDSEVGAYIEQREIVAMQSPFRVRIWKEGTTAQSRDQAFKTVASELQRVARIVDGANAASEVGQVNLRAQKAPVKVSRELIDLLQLGQKIGVRSGGVFDVTFAKIQEETEKYGESTGLEAGVNEAASDVSQALKTSVGSSNLAIDLNASTIKFAKPGIKIGVMGMARGYAAQKAAEKLARLAGFAILADNGGGEVLVAGGKALLDPKLMCVEHPSELGACAYKILPNKTAGPVLYLATSAVAERPGHIYNAKSGMRKARSGGVTVIAESGAAAQAAATAASAMDNKATQKFLDGVPPPRISAVFYDSGFSIKLNGSLEPFAKTTKSTP